MSDCACYLWISSAGYNIPKPSRFVVPTGCGPGQFTGNSGPNRGNNGSWICLSLLAHSPQSYPCWKWEILRDPDIDQNRRYQSLPCEIDMKNIRGCDIKLEPCFWLSLAFLLLLFLYIAVYYRKYSRYTVYRSVVLVTGRG